MEITSENLQKAIETLKGNLIKKDSMYFILPKCERFLNKQRYKGKGRPNNNDYDYKEIDWFNNLNEIK